MRGKADGRRKRKQKKTRPHDEKPQSSHGAPRNGGWELNGGYLPEFLTLVLFNLESLITKCLIHKVGAVISRKK